MGTRSNNLEKRGLRKAYVRCPRCGRILKVRVKQVEPTFNRTNLKDWAEHIFSRKKEWRLDQIPPHKVYVQIPDKLRTLVRTGKAPDEHPWCYSWHCSTIAFIAQDENEEGPSRQKVKWEIVGWRD